MKKVRVYTECNPTPFPSNNPLWHTGSSVPPFIRNGLLHDYLVFTLGFEQMFMVYDGTLNIAPSWCADDLTLQPLPYDLGRAGNYSNPPQQLQVNMCCELCKVSDFWLDSTWGQTRNPKFIPMIFDLEGPSYTDPEFIALNTQVITWAKARLADISVGSYFHPGLGAGVEPFNSDWNDFYDIADFAAPSFYFWDLPAQNPNQLFSSIDRHTAVLDRYFSSLHRIAVITPTYQVYYGTTPPEILALNGTPIPFDLWRRFVQYLTDRDFDLLVWGGGTLNTVEIRRLLQEVKRYQL